LLDTAHPFVWIPGEGPDPAALHRLQRRFPRPQEPMGEAWFMGADRRLFLELVEQEPGSIPVRDLMQCLEAIGTGTSSFGPLQEWDEWFHYLLPRLIPRAFEWELEYLVEYLVTAFIPLHPGSIREQPAGISNRYPAFRQDVLATLGRVLMEPTLWENGEVAVGRVLHQPYRHGKWWGWFEASGDFSALMCFCWKYLDAGQIDAWLQSVLAIRSSHCRAQLLVWLLGVRPLLAGEITQAAELEHAKPGVSWAWSHCLDGHYDGRLSGVPMPLISPPNRAAFRESLGRHLTPALVLDWLDSVARFDYLVRELGTLPDQFIEAFLARQDGSA
jgi:hypothetical protein